MWVLMANGSPGGGLSQVLPLADNITSGGGGEEASYEGYKPDDPVYCLHVTLPDVPCGCSHCGGGNPWGFPP